MLLSQQKEAADGEVFLFADISWLKETVEGGANIFFERLQCKSVEVFLRIKDGSSIGDTSSLHINFAS
jgi:hypothetical protein